MIAEGLDYRGFACPQEELDRSLLEACVIEHGRQTVQAFIERHDDRLERYASGLVPVLAGWLQREETYETVWNQAFGAMRAALLSQWDLDVERCAGALGLRLHERGHSGEWELQLDSPVHFRFDRWLLPRSKALRVSATPEMVSVHTGGSDGWRQTTFQLGEQGWDAANVDALPVLARKEILWTMLNSDALTPGMAAMLGTDLYKFSVDPQAELLLRTCDAALGLIEKYARIYLHWVGYVVRDLIPLPVKSGMHNSGSEYLLPGVICVSNQNDPWALAEMLVHEATHQYLYILIRLGSLDDGTDQTLYFSPIRNMGRPIHFIVVAYHAFGNVLLFYRKVRDIISAGGEANAQIYRRLEDLEPQLAGLEHALQTTKALTPLGRALWEPLYEEIHRPSVHAASSASMARAL